MIKMVKILEKINWNNFLKINKSVNSLFSNSYREISVYFNLFVLKLLV